MFLSFFCLFVCLFLLFLVIIKIIEQKAREIIDGGALFPDIICLQSFKSSESQFFFISIMHSLILYYLKLKNNFRILFKPLMLLYIYIYFF